MSPRVLIIPDKFKGTLSANQAAAVIAHGWRKSRPRDRLELLPMSDGGDGFGEVMSKLPDAKSRTVETMDAARRDCKATWWWEAKSKTAIIESANVIGLAMLPPGRFHPFELDTFGLGRVLSAAQKANAKQILIGIGGSATNDGGFGLARALGWKFYDKRGRSIERWTDLHALEKIRAPKRRRLGPIIVAVDVQNQLLGPRGATRVYGPQKGVRPQDFLHAERCLRRLATVMGRGFGVPASAGSDRLKAELQTLCGAGAAGGLGFGLAAFLGARLQPGFELFAKRAKLSQQLREVDLVITGEGAIDRSTTMGKGVGQIARLCHELGVPCIALAGKADRPREVKRLFNEIYALTDLTSETAAKAKPALWLEQLANHAAQTSVCVSR